MSNLELLKRIYAKDREALFGNMREDFTVHSPGQNILAGTYVGAQAFKDHIARIHALTDNTFKEELQGTFFADETWGLVVHWMTAQRNGKSLATWGFGLWRFENGLLTDHWESVGDQAHWDDFWS